MTDNPKINRVRVTRKTSETEFSIVLGPRTSAEPVAALPNRLLSHFLDHFCKASGLNLEMESLDWPGSWRFDHVLCEDLGQLVGCGVARIAEQLIAQTGIPGRADCRTVMDESVAAVALSLESRPRVDWVIRCEPTSTDSLTAGTTTPVRCLDGVREPACDNSSTVSY